MQFAEINKSGGGNSDSAIRANWLEIFKELGDSRLGLEVISFLQRHPNMRFTSGAITSVGDYSRTDVCNCLNMLVTHGIIETQTQNGTTVYCLTTDIKKRAEVIKFSIFDLRDRKDISKYYPGKFRRGEDTICA